MEFRPIFNALMRNKVGALLIALQIAITLAVVTNALHIIQQRQAYMGTPSGADEVNTFVAYTSLIDDSIDYVQQTREDLEAIRALPGVRAATTVNAVTTSWSGWGENVYLDPSDPESSFSFAQYMSDEHAPEAYDFEIIEGRFFRPEEIGTRDRNAGDYPPIMVVSKALAERLYPEESAVGKVVYDDEFAGPTTIIGVYDDLKGPWPSAEFYSSSAFIPQIGDWNYKVFWVRAVDGERDATMAAVEELLAENLDRIVLRMRSFEEVKQRTYSSDNAMIVILTTVSALLGTITALGIVGLAWFSVTRRRKIIGTRRALGATKIDILRYFMVENWIITTGGLVLGVVLAFGLNYLLDTQYEVGRITWWYVPVGMLALWILGQLAVLAPARWAASVPPALATRSV